MKRLFLFEELTAMEFEPQCPIRALLPEGLSILKALISDFSKLIDYDLFVFASLDVKQMLVAESFIDESKVIVNAHENPFKGWVRKGDAVLILAPETDKILEKRTNQLIETGAENLGCSLNAIILAGDKYSIFKFFTLNHIPTPYTLLLTDFLKNPSLTFPLVLKPRYGAGAAHTYLIHSNSELENKIPQTDSSENWIVQNFVQGLPVSYCFTVVNSNLTPVISSCQHVECIGNQFVYHGGSCPLPYEFEKRALNLAQKSLANFQGLNGWVGVDLILGNSTNGIDDFVCEINPRLTTAYLGARQLLKLNPALLWFPDNLRFSRLKRKSNTVSYNKFGVITSLQGDRL